MPMSVLKRYHWYQLVQRNEQGPVSIMLDAKNNLLIKERTSKPVLRPRNLSKRWPGARVSSALSLSCSIIITAMTVMQHWAEGNNVGCEQTASVGTTLCSVQHETRTYSYCTRTRRVCNAGASIESAIEADDELLLRLARAEPSCFYAKAYCKYTAHCHHVTIFTNPSFCLSCFLALYILLLTTSLSGSSVSSGWKARAFPLCVSAPRLTANDSPQASTFHSREIARLLKGIYLYTL